MNKKSVMAGVFGFTLGVVLSLVGGFTLSEWQWWAQFVPVAIVGVTYANTKRTPKE